MPKSEMVPLLIDTQHKTSTTFWHPPPKKLACHKLKTESLDYVNLMKKLMTINKKIIRIFRFSTL